jgi:hypothetical protein
MQPFASRTSSGVGGLLWLALLLHVIALPAGAQVSPQGRASNVAVNGALGAATATVRQVICGCFSWRGVAQGAAGGAMMGVGKQIAGTEFAASGLLGRQLNALGLSAIVSAGLEHPLLLLPLGPVTMEVRPGSGEPARARVDVTDLTVLALAVLDREMKVHWPSSIAAGAPVLLHSREWLAHGYEAHGFALLGTVFVQSRFSPSVRRELVAHESIHVLQWDALRQLATHPAERAVVRTVPRLRDAGTYLDPGLIAPASMLLLGSLIPYHAQPWEREAYLLGNGHSMSGHRDRSPTR